MYFVVTFLLIISEKILCETSSLCLIQDKCLSELKSFTQADEFHVYTSLEEAEIACSEAKDAYLCVQSVSECRDPSENAKLSPLIRGSFRLLNEFCGFKSKRRPCCALRTAYLEHSSCYEEVIERLNKCNQKYRKSLDMILTMQGEEEQKKQRFCSIKWFGNCVKDATQSYCGKMAAQIIKSYVMKAARPKKTYVKKNKECHETLYRNEGDMNGFCDHKNFKKCNVHLFFLHEYLVEDRLEDDERFLSVCVGIHDSLECLRQSFKRCMSSVQPKTFAKLQKEDLKNEACTRKKNVLQRYRGKVFCLTQHIQELSQCQGGLPVSFNQYSKYFCEFLKRLETCWIKTASLHCGEHGRKVMKVIIQMAAINIHRDCNV